MKHAFNFIFLVLLLPNFASAEPCTRKIKIGVTLPLTVTAVASGEAARDSILLADERYDKNNCAEFLIQDDSLKPQNTLTALNQFINVDHVDALMVYGTPTALAAGPVIERSKIPTIAFSILRGVVEGKNYIVKHWCTAERLNQALVEEVRRRAYKNVAIVSTSNEAMLGLRDLYKQSGVTPVVLDQEFAKEDTDFSTIVTKISQIKPTAVYVLLLPPQISVFVKRLREGRYTGEIFNANFFEDRGEVLASGGTMVGGWFVNSDNSAGENYPAEFQKRFGRGTTVGGGNGYDAAKMLIEAAQSGEDLNHYLHNIKNFHGAFGVYSATGQNDFDFPAVVKIVEKDGFRKLH